MRQQAAAAKWTREEVTLYCPPWNLELRQQLRALLDPNLPGVQVPVMRPSSYEEGQGIPDHALPRFQGNPEDNFQVLSQVPEYLCGYWTKAHQSPRWEGDGKDDIRTQENRLQKVIKGYAARATRFMTTYEYRAPGGLNHGLSALHNEVEEYMVPPMVESASALLGHFVTLYQEREFHRKRLTQLEQQALQTQSETDIETNILRAQMLGLRQGVESAHQAKERLEEQVQTISAREEKAQEALQASKEDIAQLTGELSLSRRRVGELERKLSALRKSLRSRSRTDTPASTKTEVVSSKALTVSIAQMTIGVAPPLVATTTTRQSAATPVSATALPAIRPIATPVGTADTATMVAHSAVQMTTGSPYSTHPPPPGFPYLPTGYPPYWGMYPYPISSMCRRCRPCLWEGTLRP